MKLEIHGIVGRPCFEYNQLPNGFKELNNPPPVDEPPNGFNELRSPPLLVLPYEEGVEEDENGFNELRSPPLLVLPFEEEVEEDANGFNELRIPLPDELLSLPNCNNND